MEMNRSQLGEWLADWPQQNTELVLLRFEGEWKAFDDDESLFSVSRLADDLVWALTEARARRD
jgi:hypothetical protein